MPSTYTKKNGEVISYDCRKYNAEAYAKNKEKVLSDKYECQYCNVSLLKCNKSNHNKSKKHLLVVAYANKQNATQPPEVLEHATPFHPQTMPHSWLIYAN